MYLDAKDPLASYVTVTFDGVDVTNICTIANEETSFVQVLRQDADGKFYPDKSGEEFAREIRPGKVVIALRSDAPSSMQALYHALRYKNQKPRPA